MTNKKIISSIVCLILATILCVLSFADIESEKNTEAEQHFQKANELRKIADYDAAIAEFKKVISKSPKNEIAQNAMYWIGQLYFETGRLDASLSAFKKLLDEYPDSPIIPSAKTMIERVQQAKINESFIWAALDDDIEQAKLLISQGADINTKSFEGYTALMYAIWHRNKDMVNFLVSNGSDVNFTRERGGWQLLPYAIVRTHNLDIVKLLVDKGAEYDVNIDDNWTQLHVAAVDGKRDMVEYLISKGADDSGFHLSAFMGNLDRVKEFIEKGTEVDVKDGTGWTPLFWAACGGQTKVAEFLIDNKADISVRSKNRRGIIDRSLLHQAAQTDSVKLVELLISKGIGVDVKDTSGNTPLYYTRNRDIAEMLINKGAEISAKNNNDLTPLHWQSYARKDVAELLIKKGADINAKDNQGATPLHRASGFGRKDVAELLIDKGANIDAKDNRGQTPLFSALLEDAQDVAEMLINKGTDINSKDNNGNTPLHAASARPRRIIAELLLAKGADINAKNNNNETPLHVTTWGHRSDIAELLLVKGADFKVQTNYGLTAFGLAKLFDNQKLFELLSKYANQSGNAEEIITIYDYAVIGDLEKVKSFESKGMDINAKTQDGTTTLVLASANGHRDIVEYLISKGADVNTHNYEDYHGTPLHAAATNGHKDITELLISKGAEINSKDDRGRTPLHTANANGRRDIVELLITKGADVNIKDEQNQTYLDLAGRRRGNLAGQGSGNSELHEAAAAGDIAKVKSLLSEGADVNVKASNGQTPLLVAINRFQVNKDLVELLISKGADINAKSENWGLTPLHYAILTGNREMAELFIAKGANVNAKEETGATPLFMAVGMGKDLVELLIAHNADVDAENEYGVTPLGSAEESGNIEIAELLRKNGAKKSVGGGGDTPLHRAVNNRAIEQVKSLIAEGADVNAKNSVGLTALHIVSRRDGRFFIESAKILIDNGADVNAKDKLGAIPLHLAARFGHMAMTELLIDNGADVNAKNNAGKTPKDLAQEKDYTEIVELLLKHGAKE